ncbi:MAG: hypothetical protein K0S20_289 [Patescibacteria group bacterium]|nr:hypothetical protein [Patescibacteria group bacterium]
MHDIHHERIGWALFLCKYRKKTNHGLQSFKTEYEEAVGLALLHPSQSDPIHDFSLQPLKVDHFLLQKLPKLPENPIIIVEVFYDYVNKFWILVLYA